MWCPFGDATTNGSKPDPIAAVTQWWSEMKTARGDRAELRRCHTPEEVALVPAYYQLVAVVPQWDRERLAVIAGVLAYVETRADGVRTAELFARPKNSGTNPAVSDVRFRQLLRVDDYDYATLFPVMKRLIALTDGKANLPSLIWGLNAWNSRTKMAWAQAYYMNSQTTKKE